MTWKKKRILLVGFFVMVMVSVGTVVVVFAGNWLKSGPKVEFVISSSHPKYKAVISESVWIQRLAGEVVRGGIVVDDKVIEYGVEDKAEVEPERVGVILTDKFRLKQIRYYGNDRAKPKLSSVMVKDPEGQVLMYVWVDEELLAKPEAGKEIADYVIWVLEESRSQGKMQETLKTRLLRWLTNRNNIITVAKK